MYTAKLYNLGILIMIDKDRLKNIAKELGVEIKYDPSNPSGV